jgi:hypothetical protein
MSKELKAIADFLYACANELTFEDPDARVTYMVPGTRLNITCVCTKDAVRAVADKYDHGPVRAADRYGTAYGRAESSRTGPAPTPARPKAPVQGTFFAFVEAGETDNAVAYVRLWPRDTWPRVIENFLLHSAA